MLCCKKTGCITWCITHNIYLHYEKNNPIHKSICMKFIVFNVMKCRWSLWISNIKYHTQIVKPIARSVFQLLEAFSNRVYELPCMTATPYERHKVQNHRQIDCVFTSLIPNKTTASNYSVIPKLQRRFSWIANEVTAYVVTSNGNCGILQYRSITQFQSSVNTAITLE